MEGNKTDGMNAAVAAAQAAGVVELAVGEPLWMSGEAKSRQTLALPGYRHN
jgi:hypothetical protein